jgi:hypothetical protein
VPSRQHAGTSPVAAASCHERCHVEV